MKIANRIAGFLLIAGTIAGISTYMKMNDKKSAEDGYIGRHEVVVKDGKLTPEILQYEHIRELYGEGQLFYMYKRLYAPVLFSSKYSMNPQPSDRIFTVPLPDSETEN